LVGSAMRCIESRQSGGVPGRLNERYNNENNRTLLYQLKIIDFDKKPARKLRTRHLKEVHFDNIVIDGC